MATSSGSPRRFGSSTKPVNLASIMNWPRRVPADVHWQVWKKRIKEFPRGKQTSWGIPFEMAAATAGQNVIMLTQGSGDIAVPIAAKAAYLCLLLEWMQLPSSITAEDPTEGLLAGEVVLEYRDKTTYVHPLRARFELRMEESPGPPWLALPFRMWSAQDPVDPPGDVPWPRAQRGEDLGGGSPLITAIPNPEPDKSVARVVLRGTLPSPVFVAGMTLYNGSDHPLRHLPRRAYRVKTPTGEPARVVDARVDQGGVARVERSTGIRGKRWVAADDVGVNAPVNTRLAAQADASEDILHLFGAKDATVDVTIEGRKKPFGFTLGEAFETGKSTQLGATLEVLGRRRQWMRVRVLDAASGKPTPVRLHMSGSHGEYVAPYGHHEQINTAWFADYGADVVVGGKNYAYVDGDFTTELPVGDLYVEIFKGFEFQPVREKVTIKPGQEQLDLRIERWADWRSSGWVTADTHVHFISPHTAWLEGQAEGVNVVNLLASQWGRLFTNVGDYIGRVGIAENDTIVYVGTENRNHMLGHMSMLGTQGQPVYPMCAGGPGEAWVGDPDFMTLAEWAIENKRKGGVVIRPHYPYCGHTEDPVPIIKGVVDALEIGNPTGDKFPVQEWYRYLNCGYRVAVCGGTDKMGAYCALGWQRTYAKLDANKPLTYSNWAKAVRAGRTISTSGPLLDLTADGHAIGDTLRMSKDGGTVEVRVIAESYMPLSKVELVYNGNVIAVESSSKGSKVLSIRGKFKIPGSGWFAARCQGLPNHPGAYTAAHTSPVYCTCGNTRLFNGPAAEHMLALVEGGIEYLKTIATSFDEVAQKRMVKQFSEVQKELKVRLVKESHHSHHHGDGHYHNHGHGETVDHDHV